MTLVWGGRAQRWIQRGAATQCNVIPPPGTYAHSYPATRRTLISPRESTRFGLPIEIDSLERPALLTWVLTNLPNVWSAV